MKKEWQALIDEAVAAVENAKTVEERKRAVIHLNAVKAVINAYLFNPKEMEMLS